MEVSHFSREDTAIDGMNAIHLATKYYSGKNKTGLQPVSMTIGTGSLL